MMRTLIAAAAALLALAPAAAVAQTTAQTDPAEAAGLTCDPTTATTQSVVECAVRGMAPGSQYAYSVSLPGDVLVENAGVSGGEGRSVFRFQTGTAAGAYLVSVTGTAADGAPFSAEVAGTVAAAPVPAGPVAAGFGPGTATTALAAVLLMAAVGLAVFAFRPGPARIRR